MIAILNKKILLSLGVIAFAAALAVGATIAAFTASADITGNTLSTATVSITAAGEAGGAFIAKPVSSSGLIPGQVETKEFQARIVNTSSVPLKIYMYLTPVIPLGAACPVTKFAWQSTAAVGTPPLKGYATAPTLISDSNFVFISALDTEPEKVVLTDSLAPGDSILVRQKVGLDTTAVNANQGNCVWTEQFVGETI